ncbi:MAG: hypothetical protein EHM70_02395 [Chloroflexota bacterium]|nr:MAG: hypothetical protein EHM70_02395 [Chloroflexota bacterium]
MATFPSAEWLVALKDKLNSDAGYARIAQKWEGDLLFIIEPGGSLQNKLTYYIDLWHGACRDAYVVNEGEAPKAAFVLKGTYENFTRVMKGDLDPLQAMLTRRLGMQGNMVVMMRSVPTVLDFVRCCREVTDRIA